MSVRRLDLSDHKTFAGGFPHDYFRWLRDNMPVFWHEPTAVTADGEGFWVVTRFDDVKAIQDNPQVYSSETGGRRLRGGTALNDSDSVGLALNTTDNPKHQMLRSIVAQGFTMRAVSALEEELRRRANQLIDAFPEDTEFDFVHHFSREIPLQAICLVLGVPQADRVALCDLVDHGLSSGAVEVIDPVCRGKIMEYGATIIAEKRRNPQDDILSTIVHARSSDSAQRPLTEPELLNFFSLLFAAGSETTRSAIGGGLKALIENPSQLTVLRSNPGHMKTAIEEILRWTTPSIYKRRTASVDTSILEQSVKAGDKVMFWEMSANRDDRVFDEPFKFDITRFPNKHIAFGFGAHVCLGAMLARLEIRIALQELLRRMESFELAGEVDWMPNNRLLGIRHMPLRVKFRMSRSQMASD